MTSDFPSESSTLALVEDGPAVQFGPCDVPTSFAEQVQLSDRLSYAGAILPKHLRDNAAGIHAIMLAARSLDLPMWTALQHLFVVEGHVEMSARLMRSLARRAGHRIRPVVDNASKVVLRLDRCDDPYQHYYGEFSMKDAATAKLLNKDNWLAYPRPMLRARATSVLVNLWCPEVLNGGAYLIGERPEPDDVEDTTGIEAAQVLASAAAATTVEEVNMIGKRARLKGLLPVYIEGETLDALLKSKRAELRAEAGETEAPEEVPAPAAAETEVVHTPEPMAPCGCTVLDAAMHGKRCPRKMAELFGDNWEDEAL
jgi:hypothetical protein